ncbi:hypothetical protein PG985_003994 [Apiospora marii]|uniref:uncharacterized protein n=1 Tax=Apiospora marii TaxID=335849 RepID=UPI00312EB76F
MSDLDLSISNGTCYFATNRKAADTFIPCGNAANAAYTCCLKGDVCLEGSVCFHPDGDSGGTTYIAGCTDPGFGSVAGACPHKGKFADQQIVGLVRCQDSDDRDSPDELWAGCPGDKAKTEMTGVPSPCSCSDPDFQGLFRQKPTIEAVATLPTALGQTVLFAKGHEPPPSFRAATSSAGSTPRSTTAVHSGSTAMVTTAPSTSSSAAFATGVSVSAKQESTSDQGLSAGAKAGIAVGVLLAVLLSSAIFFLAVTLRRRRHRTSRGGADVAEAETEAAEAAAKAPLTTTEDLATPPTGEQPPPPHNSPDPATAVSMSRGDAGSPRNHAGDEWFKPELAADESTTVSSSSPNPATVLDPGHKSGMMRDSRVSPSADSDTLPSYYQGGGGGSRQARRSPSLASSLGRNGGSGRGKAMEDISELQG